MGIVKLADLIRLEAPNAISHKDVSDYTDEVIALDTSIVMNQFRTAIPSLNPLTGLFFRTLTFLERDIKPVFVLDGPPPEEKIAALRKRARAAGWPSPYRLGTGSVQKQDCFHLLKLLGVPVLQAPGDAERLCAWLVRRGSARAVASEDTDSLPFGAQLLLRQLDAKKDGDIVEYSLPKLLGKLQLTHKEFVDLCILLGCDYCDKITGLGPKRALTLIQKYRSIENVLLHINRRTHPVPNDWKYEEARKLFLEEPCARVPELMWTEPDEDALVGFLCRRTYVKEERIRRRMERFRQIRESERKRREKETAEGGYRQTRMQDFFRVLRKREQPTESADPGSSNRKKHKLK
ncbi:probable flap endonuclease 1 homolog isoform X1 [Corythoichthys intestinalis]|uniref:probable flap endonuclease 1 homolog isoform X1 n=2 Tax=Corythoichthys intestinalis TaxID=161448 RepID=UPI0025A68BA3|nr:probable flap endonuclease 1 homolog isoform X1 [Corythoichthys intestinalis]